MFYTLFFIGDFMKKFLTLLSIGLIALCLSSCSNEKVSFYKHCLHGNEKKAIKILDEIIVKNNLETQEQKSTFLNKYLYIMNKDYVKFDKYFQKYLKKADINFDSIDLYIDPISIATVSNNLNLVQTLVSYGFTPLTDALTTSCILKHNEIASYLVDISENINVRAIRFILWNDNLDLFQKSLQKFEIDPANIFKNELYNDNILTIAASKGSINCVKYIVENNFVEINELDEYNKTPLDYASSPEVIQYLKEHKAEKLSSTALSIIEKARNLELKTRQVKEDLPSEYEMLALIYQFPEEMKAITREIKKNTKNLTQWECKIILQHLEKAYAEFNQLPSTFNYY